MKERRQGREKKEVVKDSSTEDRKIIKFSASRINLLFGSEEIKAKETP